MKLPILIAMGLYMAMVVWIGVYYSKKTKTSEDDLHMPVDSAEQDGLQSD